MGAGINSSWEKIQQGVKEVERLIGQKEYNTAMIRARQTLEFMVKLLAERSGVPDGSDLKHMIDILYQNRRITKNTCERYHRIRIIGNKAVHESDASPYNANQAYHLLSQEVYAFANDYRNASRGSRPRQGTRRTASGSSARNSASSRSRKKQPQRPVFTPYDLMKLLVPVLCILLLVLVIRLVRPGKDTTETTTAPQTAEQTTDAPETMGSEPETTASAAPSYHTTSTLNVRPQPSTDTQRIGQLEAGSAVEYVGAYDSDWAIILYNGQEAYVASQYLTAQ